MTDNTNATARCAENDEATALDYEAVARPHLRDSRPLAWSKAPKTRRCREAVRVLLNELEASEERTRARRKADRDGLEEVLGLMLAELWSLQCSSPSQWLAYARGSDTYPSGSRYRPSSVTLTRVTTVADFLIRAGYAEGKAGSYGREDFGFGTSGRGYLSRLRGTARLSLWAKHHGLIVGEDIASALGEVIVLRQLRRQPSGAQAEWVAAQYEDTAEIANLRRGLLSWQRMMQEHRVVLPQCQTEGVEGIDEECRLHRVFNGSWERGGRFYGGWWLEVASGQRPRMTINGEAVVELDFGGLHPRLCYQLQGMPLACEADPYAIEGVDPALRSDVKVAFMRLLNTSSQRALGCPSKVSEQLRGGGAYAAFAEAVEEHHKPIADWFRNGPRGLELQAIDAEIAEVVMATFTALGRPVLPVHDSFIVAASDEELLRQAMTDAYLTVVGKRCEDPLQPCIRLSGV